MDGLESDDGTSPVDIRLIVTAQIQSAIVAEICEISVGTTML